MQERVVWHTGVHVYSVCVYVQVYAPFVYLCVYNLEAERVVWHNGVRMSAYVRVHMNIVYGTCCAIDTPLAEAGTPAYTHA